MLGWHAAEKLQFDILGQNGTNRLRQCDLVYGKPDKWGAKKHLDQRRRISEVRIVLGHGLYRGRSCCTGQWKSRG
jgi:hypothetical protein